MNFSNLVKQSDLQKSLHLVSKKYFNAMHLCNKKYVGEYVSMTSLLTHNVAHFSGIPLGLEPTTNPLNSF